MAATKKASATSSATTQGEITGEFNGVHSDVGPVDFPMNYGGRFWDVRFGLSAEVPIGALKICRPMPIHWIGGGGHQRKQEVSMKQTLLLPAALLALLVTGCGTISTEAQLKTALSLTKEHFRNTATVQDDSLDTVAKITTVNGFQERHGLLGIVSDDNFLRAFIDKKSGQTLFQLYQVIYYEDGAWNFFYTANFETPSGPQSKLVTVIKRDVVGCPGARYISCTYVEHVTFDVDESMLRTIAAKYSPGQRTAWKFKFDAKSGQEYKDGMLAAEIAGLLEKVDEYRGIKVALRPTPVLSGPEPASKPALNAAERGEGAVLPPMPARPQATTARPPAATVRDPAELYRRSDPAAYRWIKH